MESSRQLMSVVSISAVKGQHAMPCIKPHRDTFPVGFGLPCHQPVAVCTWMRSTKLGDAMEWDGRGMETSRRENTASIVCLSLKRASHGQCRLPVAAM